MFIVWRFPLLDSFKAWNSVPIKSELLILVFAPPFIKMVTLFMSELFSNGMKSKQASIFLKTYAL